jgi:hypothetical protein
VSRLMDVPVPLRIEHHLGDSRAVSKIDKHHHAMVAPALYPSLQNDGLSDMGLVQFSAAMVSLFHIMLAFFTNDEKALLPPSRIA